MKSDTKAPGKGKGKIPDFNFSEDLKGMASQFPRKDALKNVVMDDDFSKKVEAMAFDQKPSNRTKPKSEVSTILDLLDLMEQDLMGAEKKNVADKLLLWVRLMGAGGLGSQGTEYDNAKAEVDASDKVKNEFIKFLGSKSPETRGWSASFIEQLFQKKSAINSILNALSNEGDGTAASWMALSLARLGRSNPRICDYIADAYKRFMGEFNVDLQIARAWGYAGCQGAAPVLAQHLRDGGYDQKSVALDGLRSLGDIEDATIQPTIAEVMLHTEWDNISDECIQILQQFGSISSDVRALVQEAADGDVGDRSYNNAQKALKVLTDIIKPEPPESELKWPSADEYVSRYTSDMPLGEKVVDCIDVESEARAFAKVAAAKEVYPPLAIGIFGEWGSGKTFFMKRIFANVIDLANLKIKKGNKSPFCRQIVQIRFNAWHYMESNLWASLVDYIFQELNLWLHRQKQEQSTIDALFDRLSTARQLKLESIQAVIEARKERRRAVKRLDVARQEYENAVVRKSAYSSKAFWKAVFDTFTEEDKEVIEDASNKLGLGQIAGSAESLNATIEEAASQAGRAKVLLRATFSKLGQGGTVFLLIVLLVLMPAGLFGLRELLASNLYLEWTAKINDLTIGIVGLLTAITSVVGLVSHRAAGALNTLHRFHEKLDEAIDSETGEPKQYFAAAQREVAVKEAELEQAEQNLGSADERAEAAVQEWKAATPRGRLNRFIREKVIGGEYAKHLGIIAAIRKDFGQLAEMVSKESSDESSQQLYQKAQEEYKAEVKRLIAEASDSKEFKDILDTDEIKNLENSTNEDPSKLPSFERIILYIDDLDRCPPDKVVSVLQAIHLLLCFKLFVVVVAVDARWISRALIKEYPELLEENVMWIEPNGDGNQKFQYHKTRVGASSHDYLEKIFQIPYWVRPMDPDACIKYVKHLTKIDSEKESSDTDHVPEIDDIDTRALDDTVKQETQPGGGEATEKDLDKKESGPTEKADKKLPDDDLDPSQDAFAGMYITDYEVKMLEYLAQFAGSSPRRNLRFVNVYRLIKSSLKSDQLNDLVGGRGESLGYRAIITQLAISTGAPKIAQFYFQIIINKDRQIKSITDLLDRLEKESRIAASSEWPQLRGALKKLRELNEKEKLDIGSDMILALRESASIARRYSFTARPA